MKKHLLFLSIISALLLFNSCQKEVSFEENDSSEGSLQSDITGECLPKNVGGVYQAGKALDAANFIDVGVIVVQTGAYTITSDTINGVYFNSTGIFSTTGLNTVRLKGNGTPVAEGINNYTINYDSTECTVAVTTLPAGGVPDAAFTLDGSPNTCMNYHVYGSFATGVALTPSNNVVIYIHVTTPGAYNVSTAASNGIIFSGTGTLNAAGADSIRLTATGTPVSGGTINVTITIGSTTCSFPVTVTAPAVFTVNCGTAVVHGTYTQGTALVPANTIDIPVDVTTAGSYTITGTINGMTFAKSASFAGTGAQTITLTGTGSPVNAGNFNLSVTGGTAACDVPITVNPATNPPTNAVFTVNCAAATVHGTYKMGVALVPATNTIDIEVNVSTPGTYTISGTVNGMTFTKTGTFAGTGVQAITLAGSGTPTAAGGFNVPIGGGTAPCNVPLTVDPATVPGSDYFPRTANSNWSYEANDDPMDSLLRKATASTKTVGSNVYTIFMATIDATQGFDSSGYYRKSGNDYYEFLDIGSTYGLDEPMWKEYIFLKDNLNAGQSWQSATYDGMLGGTPFTFRLNYSIAQKDVTMTINNITYQNVIVVNEKIDVQFIPGVWEDVTDLVGYFKTYYARGVGMIKQESIDETGTSEGMIEARRTQVF